MSRYRRIQVSLHADPDYCRLSKPAPNAQTLFLHLLAGPLTTILPGLIRVGVAALAEELGWSPAATANTLQEIVTVGLAKFDADARLIFVPRAVMENIPASPNVVRHWKDTWAELPACELKREAQAHFEAVLSGVGAAGAYAIAFREITGSALKTSRKRSSKASRKAFGKGSRNQEQEQEQEQEQDKERFAPEVRLVVSPFEEFYRAYPRKKGKDAAQKAWKAKKLAAHDVPRLVAAIERQKRSPEWRKDGGQFIPYPATWLNQGRWKDEETAALDSDSAARRATLLAERQRRQESDFARRLELEQGARVAIDALPPRQRQVLQDRVQSELTDFKAAMAKPDYDRALGLAMVRLVVENCRGRAVAESLADFVEHEDAVESRTAKAEAVV